MGALARHFPSNRYGAILGQLVQVVAAPEHVKHRLEQTIIEKINKKGLFVYFT